MNSKKTFGSLESWIITYILAEERSLVKATTQFLTIIHNSMSTSHSLLSSVSTRQSNNAHPQMLTNTDTQSKSKHVFKKKESKHALHFGFVHFREYTFAFQNSTQGLLHQSENVKQQSFDYCTCFLMYSTLSENKYTKQKPSILKSISMAPSTGGADRSIKCSHIEKNPVLKRKANKSTLIFYSFTYIVSTLLFGKQCVGFWKQKNE